MATRDDLRRSQQRRAWKGYPNPFDAGEAASRPALAVAAGGCDAVDAGSAVDASGAGDPASSDPRGDALLGELIAACWDGRLDDADVQEVKR